MIVSHHHHAARYNRRSHVLCPRPLSRHVDHFEGTIGRSGRKRKEEGEIGADVRTCPSRAAKCRQRHSSSRSTCHSYKLYTILATIVITLTCNLATCFRPKFPMPHPHSHPCRRPRRCCCCSRHYSLDFLRIRHCQGHVFVIAAIAVFLSYLPSPRTCLRRRLAPFWIRDRQRRSPLKAHTVMPSIKEESPGGPICEEEI